MQVDTSFIQLLEVIREERQALHSAIERLKRLDTRLLDLETRLESKRLITSKDLKIIIRDIFGMETLENEKYDVLLSWIKENC